MPWTRWGHQLGFMHVTVGLHYFIQVVPQVLTLPLGVTAVGEYKWNN